MSDVFNMVEYANRLGAAMMRRPAVPALPTPPQPMPFAVGTRVRHRTLGAGTVRTVCRPVFQQRLPMRAIVEFDAQGLRPGVGTREVWTEDLQPMGDDAPAAQPQGARVFGPSVA